MTLAPVAVFAYRRPNHLRQCLAALRSNDLARESDLHIFCDGAKTPEDTALTQEVAAISRGAEGFRSVSVKAQARNIGLANSIIAGVTDLCDRFGRVIVVEDDLVVAPCFLRFMNDGLTRYESADRVMQIAGYMFPIQPRFATRAFFLPVPTSWGWATWQRAWQHFNPLTAEYATLQRSRNLRHQFDLDGAYPYFEMLERQREGTIDSWAIRWHLSCFIRQGLTLFPGTSLVRNIGFDGSGTHGGRLEPSSQGPAAELAPDHRFDYPLVAAPDSAGYAQVKRALRRANAPGVFSFMKRLWR